MEELSLEKRILMTNDWGLVALLNEAMIDILSGLVEEESQDLDGDIDKIKDILTELIVVFSGEDKLSLDLRSLYLFINKEITRGLINKDKAYFQNSIDLIRPLYEGFLEKSKEEEARVVSGLTYGRDDLGDYENQKEKTFEA